MATSGKKPVKGILKNSSSFDKAEPTSGKTTKWDEMNIIATLHPADKDYGHMKIEEPKTPYSKYKDPEEEGCERRTSIECISDDDRDVLNPENVLKRLEGNTERRLPPDEEEEEEEESSEGEEESDELKAQRHMFEQKRKLHYNEFFAKKLAKQLMEEDEEEDDDDK